MYASFRLCHLFGVWGAKKKKERNWIECRRIDSGEINSNKTSMEIAHSTGQMYVQMCACLNGRWFVFVSDKFALSKVFVYLTYFAIECLRCWRDKDDLSFNRKEETNIRNQRRDTNLLLSFLFGCLMSLASKFRYK